METQHSGKEFLAQMRSGSLRPSLIRIGMAKPGDAEADVILFSESETCGRWVAVPLDLVESVQVIGWMACDDHKHPIVRLRLHEPAADNKHARMLAELLTARDTASEPAGYAPGGQADEQIAPTTRRVLRGGGDLACLRSCQDDYKSGPPFLHGNALGACLRSCRRECGFR